MLGEEKGLQDCAHYIKTGQRKAYVNGPMCSKGTPATWLSSIGNTEVERGRAWDSSEAVDGDSCISGRTAATSLQLPKPRPGAGCSTSARGSTGRKGPATVAPPAAVTAAGTSAGLSEGHASVAAGDGGLRSRACACPGDSEHWAPNSA